MSVYKRGGFWWYRFEFRGQQIAESTKQSNKGVALDQERTHRLRLSNDELGIIREKVPTPALKTYLNETILPWAQLQFAQSPKSYKWYRDNTKVLCHFAPIASARLDDIGKQLVEDFKAWRSKQGLSPHTVNSSLRVLRSVLHRATLERLRPPLVKGEIIVVSGAKSRDHVVTREEEMKYLPKCTEPLRTVAIIMLDAGLRPEEVFRLKWECITFTEDGGRILNEQGKSKAARRTIAMTRRLRDILYQRWEQASKLPAGWVFPAQKAKAGHIVPNSVYQPHQDAVEKSGVRRFVLYSLRHTFLTRLGATGKVDAWTLAKIAGHSDVNVSKHYVHINDDDAARAIEEMESSCTKSVQNRKHGLGVATSSPPTARRKNRA